MKIFKWWHVLLIVGGVIIVATLFLVVAFSSSLENVQRWSLFSTMFFGLASACLSLVALGISITTFAINNRQKREKLENEAKLFIVNHEEELSYIPLCLIASAYRRHGKCLRPIYTEFNKLSNEQQAEVLKQLNYDCKLIISTDWVDDSLEKVKRFIADNNLGRDLLYDDAKYYKRAYDHREQKYELKDEYVHIFRSDLFGKPNYVVRGFYVGDDGLSFDDFMHRFLRAKENDDPVSAMVQKPIDYLASLIRFNDCEEHIACFWMMVVVDCCAELLIAKLSKEQKIERLPACEGNIETYEDRFFMSLATLYDLSKFENKK